MGNLTRTSFKKIGCKVIIKGVEEQGRASVYSQALCVCNMSIYARACLPINVNKLH